MTTSMPNSDEQFYLNLIQFLESDEIGIGVMTEKELDAFLKVENISFPSAQKQFASFWSAEKRRHAFRLSQARRRSLEQETLNIVPKVISATREAVLARIRAILDSGNAGLATIQYRNLQDLSDRDLLTLEQDLQILLKDQQDDEK